MRHENNFGEVRLPFSDGEGLRLQLAITEPREACECATAWIGEADTVLDVINDGIFNDIMIPAGHIKARPGTEIHETGQKLYNLMIGARRGLAMAKEVVDRLHRHLPAEAETSAPPLRRAVIDLRENAWDRALAEYTEANAADARIEEGPDGVYTDQAPAKFAALLSTPTPTIYAFHAKLEIVLQDIFADDAGDPRLMALSRDLHALMARQSRDTTSAEAA